MRSEKTGSFHKRGSTRIFVCHKSSPTRVWAFSCPDYTFLLPVVRINLQVLTDRWDNFAQVDPVSIWRHGIWTRGTRFMYTNLPTFLALVDESSVICNRTETITVCLGSLKRGAFFLLWNLSPSLCDTSPTHDLWGETCQGPGVLLEKKGRTGLEKERTEEFFEISIYYENRSDLLLRCSGHQEPPPNSPGVVFFPRFF